jgi:hypothetical protein
MSASFHGLVRDAKDVFAATVRRVIPSSERQPSLPKQEYYDRLAAEARAELQDAETDF